MPELVLDVLRVPPRFGSGGKRQYAGYAARGLTGNGSVSVAELGSKSNAKTFAGVNIAAFPGTLPSWRLDHAIGQSPGPFMGLAAIWLKGGRLLEIPAAVLVGARQSGKTTLARMLSDLYFDLEQPADRLRLDLEWDSIVAGRRNLSPPAFISDMD